MSHLITFQLTENFYEDLIVVQIGKDRYAATTLDIEGGKYGLQLYGRYHAHDDSARRVMPEFVRSYENASEPIRLEVWFAAGKEYGLEGVFYVRPLEKTPSFDEKNQTSFRAELLSRSVVEPEFVSFPLSVLNPAMIGRYWGWEPTSSSL